MPPRSLPPDDRAGRLDRFGLAPGNRPLFDALIDRARFGAFVTDAQGACLYANDRLCELTGLPYEQQLGFGWRQALHPDDVARVAEAWEEAQRNGSALAQDQRFVRPDGSIAWVEVSASIVLDDDGGVAGWAGVCIDVTDRRLSDDRYRQLVENARDAVFAGDRQGNFVSVNRAAEEISGYSHDELRAMGFLDLVAPEERERLVEVFVRGLQGEGEGSVETELVRKDGSRAFVEATYRMLTEDGEPAGFEAIVRDTTERRLLQEQLAHQAFHDPLTGLPNRALLLDRLGRALAGARRPGAPAVAVILLDLDNFKLVNDSLGHDVGDELLVALAGRLSREMRAGDTAARLGGDEFALVIESLRHELDAIAVVERMLAALEEPFAVGGGTQRVTASVGIAIAEAGDDPGAVIRNADTAMYAAKAREKGGFELFDDGMRSRVLRELAVKNALAEALAAQGLELFYQPIVALDDGAILAVEALVRWPHREWGWVQPNEFIPIAEADGQILPLGRFVFVEAARQAAYWQERHPDSLPLGVFVNVSARQLAAPDYAGFVRQTLREQGVDASRLGLELTERAFVDDRDEHIGTNLAELAAMGVRLSLDDFGTGYSALSSLKRLPLAALKIDRFFTRSIRTPNTAAPIAAAIVSMGRALDLTVIAEGVETEAQADHYRRLGCQAAQGYLFARPAPAEAVTVALDTASGERFARVARGER